MSLAPFLFLFLILTACRSNEVLGAKWGENDREARIWTVPEARMKGRRAHRVPLSDAALAVLSELEPFAWLPGGFLFPGMKRGRPINDRALGFLLRDLERTDCTPHGFRSSFRDWCAEQTSFPREIAEAALAHSNRDAVEAAYQRTDFFEKRAKLMDAWASFVTTEPGTNVVSLKGKRRRAR